MKKKELELENRKLRKILENYPHNPKATSWFMSQNNWYWQLVAPVLGVEPVSN